MPHAESVVDADANVLVPFVPTIVRICRYSVSSALVGIAVLQNPVVLARLEREMNAFPQVPACELTATCPPTEGPLFFVTLARPDASIEVGEEGGCGLVTNGARTVGATATWRDEMAWRTPTTSIG